jgi:DNA-binding transcriptional LysR family regulator
MLVRAGEGLANAPASPVRSSTGGAMQVNQLHAFLAVARCLSFSRAAQSLYLSQPALSAQIKALERDLGVQLFRRGPSGTRLTREGLDLLNLAREAVAAVAEVELAARGIPRCRRRFVVGLMDYALGGLTWPLLGAFHDARPDLQITVVRARFFDAAICLREGAFDVLLGIGPFGTSQFHVAQVASMPLSAVVPAHHPLAGADVIEAAWLAERVTIGPPEGMGKEWVGFWSLREWGGRPPERLIHFPPDTRLDHLPARIAHGGHVAAWPSSAPAGQGIVLRPLDLAIEAPVEIASRHDAHQDVHDFVAMATRLAGVP